jgi:hypothetical protein
MPGAKANLSEMGQLNVSTKESFHGLNKKFTWQTIVYKILFKKAVITKQVNFTVNFFSAHSLFSMPSMIGLG